MKYTNALKYFILTKFELNDLDPNASLNIS